MVVVALAGASTGLGLQILRQIVATQKHTVILLSRSENASISALGVDVRPVDYTSHASLVAALAGVHTVLSIMGSVFEAGPQLALIEAAKAAGVRRFSPSDYAVPSYEGIDAYSPKIAVWAAARASGLEVTRFSPGLFMNAFGTRTPKGEEEALGGLRPWDFVVNVSGGTADLPGDGSQPLTLTETSDIGRFVAAALDLPAWPLDLEMAGDTKTYREALEILERVQKRKFLVKENSVEELERMAEVPEARFYNQARIVIAKGGLQTKPTLNELFPDIKPLRLEEYIEKWWSGVELPEPKWEAPKIFGQGNMDRDR